jgi:Sulfotransferase family
MTLARRWSGRFRRRGGPVGPPAPFIVGVGRSGTTLLRLMLDSHPHLAIGPETGFAPEVVRACRRHGAAPEELMDLLRAQRSWGDFDLPEDELERRFAAAPRLDAGTALRTLYGLYAEDQGKPRWGDKTPAYVKRMPMISEALPEARFIHVIRDGRDVALSRARRADEPATPERAAGTWRKRILRAREQARRLDHYLEVRYEDLVTDTEPTLRRIAGFVELPWDDAMLRYYERAPERLAEISRDLPATGQKSQRSGSERAAAHALAKEPPTRERIAAWREQMSVGERAAFESVAGDLLAELGYEVGG